MADKGYKIEFLYGAQDYPSKDDRELMAFIEHRLSCKWSVVTPKSLDEWLGCIEKATLLVSGRFHHSIAAACLGTPFIALNSNTPKIDGLLKVLNHNSVLNYNDNDLLTKLLSITEELKQKNQPVSNLENLCNKALQNFRSLKELALSVNDKETRLVEKDKSWQPFISKDSNTLESSII